MGIAYEPFSKDHSRDPYSVYRQLRDRAPVYWAPESRNWVLSRYEDVARAFKDTDHFSSRMDNRKILRGRGFSGAITTARLLLGMLIRMRMTPGRALNSRMLIQTDGKVHARMREIVNRGFSPKRIACWEARVREIVQDCMVDLRRGECFDLVDKLAIPLPMRVIAEVLGVEAERREDFKRWSDQIATTGFAAEAEEILSGGVIDVLGEMRDYLMPIIRERRRVPADDLISVLVEAQASGAALDDYETFMFIFLLLVAGNITTTNLIGNAVDALFAHPDQLERVVDDPKRVPALVEETLRFDAPVQMLQRTVRRDIELHGTRLPVGSEVVLLIGSANRDERRFPDPDRLDVDRDTRGHLGFGFGEHFCLGASLARLEARAALEAVVPELRWFVPARSERSFVDSYVIRGRSHLELKAA